MLQIGDIVRLKEIAGFHNYHYGIVVSCWDDIQYLLFRVRFEYEEGQLYHFVVSVPEEWLEKVL